MFQKRFLHLAAGGIVTAAFYHMIKNSRKCMTLLKADNHRYLDSYHLLNHWLEIKNEGKCIADYFRDMNYENIAVYGMGELANRLSEDLAGSGIRIVYGIDRDAGCSIARIRDVYSPQDVLPEADMVVVTPYYAFDSIKRSLAGKVKCPVISIEEIVWSI